MHCYFFIKIFPILDLCLNIDDVEFKSRSCFKKDFLFIIVNAMRYEIIDVYKKNRKIFLRLLFKFNLLNLSRWKENLFRREI